MPLTAMNNNVLDSCSPTVKHTKHTIPSSSPQSQAAPVLNQSSEEKSVRLAMSSNSEEKEQSAAKHLKLPKIPKAETNESKLDKAATEFYFSYGSNMLPTHLQKCKNIHPVSIRRGVIPGWRLSFSCAILSNRSDPCFANIVSHRVPTTPSSTTAATLSPSYDDEVEEQLQTQPAYNNAPNQHQVAQQVQDSQPQSQSQSQSPLMGIQETVVEDHSNDPYVNGSIIEVESQVFDRLDGYEFTYVRKQVEAYVYDEDGGGTLNVWVYVMDKKHEEYLNTNHPQQRYKFVEMPPSKNYLQTLVEGAKAIGLHDEYVEYLQSQSFQPYLKLQPSPKTQAVIDGTVFSMQDVQQWNKYKSKSKTVNLCDTDGSNEIKGPLMVLKGVVFDLNKSPPYFQKVYGGNDITLKQAARWVYANHVNTQSIDALQDEQKLFINNVLMGALMGGSILGKCVGKLHDNEKYGYHYYKW